MFFDLRIATTALLGLALPLSRPGQSQFTCLTTRESVSSAGLEGNAWSHSPDVSFDGRFVAFTSSATNLVPADLNGCDDVFVRDRLLRTTVRASIAHDGAEPNGDSGQPRISEDGRYVTFASHATNLVAAGSSGLLGVYVRDLETGAIRRVDTGLGGVEPNGQSYRPCVSADGRYVTFSSYASNLVPGDTNGFADVFVWDRDTGLTSLASVSLTGGPGAKPSEVEDISANGRFVSFNSSSSDLVLGDTNHIRDVFVRDMELSVTVLVSVSTSGVQGDRPSATSRISSDGRFVAFVSESRSFAPDTNQTYDIFLRDLLSGTTTMVSVNASGTNSGNYHSHTPSLSADGRYVAFESRATDLIAGDTNGEMDVFVRDMLIGNTERASLSLSGTEANDMSRFPCIAPEGRLLAFTSTATNLVSGDTNGCDDVFVRDCPAPPATYCTAKTSSVGCVPTMIWSGTPSATGGSGFDVGAVQIMNQQSGLLFFGISGPLAAPFQGGTMCVAPPKSRTPLQNSGGTPPPTSDCSGAFSLDFNALLQAGGQPELAAGVQVDAQYWYRDPGAPSATGLSDALEFVLLP